MPLQTELSSLKYEVVDQTVKDLEEALKKRGIKLPEQPYIKAMGYLIKQDDMRRDNKHICSGGWCWHD